MRVVIAMPVNSYSAVCRTNFSSAPEEFALAALRGLISCGKLEIGGMAHGVLLSEACSGEGYSRCSV